MIRVLVKLQKNNKVVSIDAYEYVPPNNEDALKKGVAHQPVSVGIEAYGYPFMLYKSVIFLILIVTLSIYFLFF